MNTNRVGVQKAKKKWIDDLTQISSVNLNKVAIPVDECNLVRPLPWHARTGHVLPESDNPAQEALLEVFRMADKAKMVVNYKKTKTMIFNRAKLTDIEPFLTAPNGQKIEYTDKAKLLGVIINERMTTSDNTKNIETKSYKRMWIIKRLANLGCSKDDLLMTYVRQIRSICEFASPFWGPMITLDESRRIERIQRTALHIILGPEFTCYSRAMEITGM